MTIRRLALACVLARAALLGQDVECASTLDAPGYPRLARLANISGTVTARFTIVAGRAEGALFDGHPVLAKEAAEALQRTGFPEACGRRRLEITFVFRLQGEFSDKARTSVRFEPPARYVVTSNATGVLSGAHAQPSQPEDTRRKCSRWPLFRRKIVSQLGVVEFRVPLRAEIRKGEDVD